MKYYPSRENSILPKEPSTYTREDDLTNTNSPAAEEKGSTNSTHFLSAAGGSGRLEAETSSSKNAGTGEGGSWRSERGKLHTRLREFAIGEGDPLSRGHGERKGLGVRVSCRIGRRLCGYGAPAESQAKPTTRLFAAAAWDAYFLTSSRAPTRPSILFFFFFTFFLIQVSRN